MKPKFTPTENELMGRVRSPLAARDEKAGVMGDDAVMPSLEARALKANAHAVDSMLTLIGCLQMNHDDLPRLDEADRKAALGDGEEKDWQAYGDLHLAVDAGKPEDTRMHYLLPVVKSGCVHTRTLKLVVAAASDETKEVAEAAWRLCKAAGLIADGQVMRPRREGFACPVMASGRSCPMNAAGRCAHLSDAGDCRIAGGACPLVAGEKPACPLMAAGEGCPMDQWSGCVQLEENAECRLQDGAHCGLVKEEKEDEGDD